MQQIYSQAKEEAIDSTERLINNSKARLIGVTKVTSVSVEAK